MHASMRRRHRTSGARHVRDPLLLPRPRRPRMSEADRERWVARWRERSGGPKAPEPFLVRNVDALVPEAGLGGGRSLLDVAAGDGRNALWLAGRGFAVTAVDASTVAIARLDAAAEAQGIAVTTQVADLDAAGALAGLGPFDGLVIVRFKPSAAQWAALAATLRRPGGRVLLCSFGLGQHRRHGFPDGFCLERGELEAGLTPVLRLLRWESFEEGEEEDGACLEGSLWERR